MTPEQALQILNQAAAQLTTNRQGHAQLVEAVKVLGDFIRAQKIAESQDHSANPS